MLGMGSPLWALANLTPPAPDLQQGAASANNQQLAARSQDSLPPPAMQTQLSWDQNNMQVHNSNSLIVACACWPGPLFVISPQRLPD